MSDNIIRSHRRHKTRRKSLLFLHRILLTLGAVLCCLITLVSVRDHRRTCDDRICYLAAKYESNGDPGSIGEDIGYLAYGEFQFYYTYHLVPFIQYCYEEDPEFYAAFRPYLEMSEEEIPDEGFRQVWTGIASSDRTKFEKSQQQYVLQVTLKTALHNLQETYGYDFTHASDALKGCILSIANRDGTSSKTLSRCFGDIMSCTSEEEIITRAYEAMQAYRPDSRRWVLEEEDCLAMLHGRLNIYKASENEAGGIDWSWKK